MEVVVLLVVGGLVVGLLAVLLARQRETGLRLQCMNNLRRIGMGVRAFQDDRAFLPPARIAPDYATWAVLLVPYIQGQEPNAPKLALTGWDVSRTYFAQPAAIRETLVPPYLCPARTRSSWLSVAGDVDPASQKHEPGAVGDYAGVAGTGDPAHAWDGANADGAIVLGVVLERQGERIVRWDGRTSLPAIQAAHGLSTTLLIGEKHVPWDRMGQAAVGDGSLYDGQSAAGCTRIAGPGYGLAASVTAPFNDNFGSAHPGVCQFLQADGSVRTFANDVSPLVLGAMARRWQ